MALRGGMGLAAVWAMTPCRASSGFNHNSWLAVQLCSCSGSTWQRFKGDCQCVFGQCYLVLHPCCFRLAAGFKGVSASEAFLPVVVAVSSSCGGRYWTV